ncbi:rRNA N(6)-adenosine-methyltransferase ZCCHC4-like [Babylonia areolata]|uniref:rRNA N(6)-adenosine-methyltransferase ZCCHC4-like n=1 Tax=Babylonia areolata TaxID=304850 RepID=UPI003FD2BF54
MAASCTNTEVIVDVSSADVPCCSHGPTLLFERYTKSKGNRKFYACSAFRDRKLCGFFRWADEGRKEEDSPHTSDPIASSPGCHFLSRLAQRKKFLQFKKQGLSKRCLCSTCGLLLLAEEVMEHEDKGHCIKRRITKAALQHPTTLFEPQEDNKSYAQYLFADSAVKFLVQRLEDQNNKTHVLCVGTPRLHEVLRALRREGNTQMSSLLMDLDSRYAQVYSKKVMCRYNMFNHHFFDPHGEDQFKSFVREAGRGLVLVTDPPFGGMVEALVTTLRKIEKTWKTEVLTDADLPVVWFFPYFMEKRVCECLPSLTMLDYKVPYDNHNLFQNVRQGGRKKGSPVRIFTNLPLLSFPLPSSEGYWFCDVCQRFSAPENAHCFKCNSCTSKDGTTYAHCDACGRCVKATRVHCPSCGVCDLPEHICGQRRGDGCHICGDLDHKRRECPQRNSPSTRIYEGKRSAKQAQVIPKKKRRTK